MGASAAIFGYKQDCCQIILARRVSRCPLFPRYNCRMDLISLSLFNGLLRNSDAPPFNADASASASA
ncbi:hypothetical protein D9M68_744310 [compost metagenome]